MLKYRLLLGIALGSVILRTADLKPATSVNRNNNVPSPPPLPPPPPIKRLLPINERDSNRSGVQSYTDFVDVADYEMWNEMFLDDHLHPQAHRGDEYHDTSKRSTDRKWELRMQNYQWIHNSLSHLHAIVCMIMYLSIVIKIRRQKKCFGLSFQAMVALTVSELMHLFLRCLEYHRTRRFEMNMIHTDLLSSVLSLWCCYSIHSHFEVSRDGQLDTFGLNLCNWLYLRIFLLKLCPNFGQANHDKKSGRSMPMSWVRTHDGMGGVIDMNFDILKQNRIHLGQLKPIGIFGVIFTRLYWLALYICFALPLAILLIAFKVAINGSRAYHWITFYVGVADSIRSVALIPQLYMFELKHTRKISEQLLLYVGCEIFLKILALLYWVSYGLFYSNTDLVKAARVYSIVVQGLNLIIIVRLMWSLINPLTRGMAIEKSSELEIPLQISSPRYGEDANVGTTRSRQTTTSATRGRFTFS